MKNVKRVLYLCNYSTNYIHKLRNNELIFSQAANNKIEGIVESLICNGCEVIILSSGLVNCHSFRYFPSVEEKNSRYRIFFAGMRDIPVWGNFSSALNMYKLICKLHKEKNVDNIIFYNFKPEVAFAALWAKRNLGIPITVEYEDGYADVSEIKRIKKNIFIFVEDYVSKYIDSAILVNSQLKAKFSVPTVVVRGIINKEFYNYCQNYKKYKNRKFTILYAGDLGESRGIDILYESLKYLHLDCEVIITGKGEVRSKDPRINFKGFVSHEEVIRLMNQADLLVQCQRTGNSFSNVSFPSKLFEYIATGNMIISSDIGEVRKFAGNSIIYYKGDEGENLAEAIEMAYFQFKNDNNRNNRKELCEENLPEQIGKKIVKILK